MSAYSQARAGLKGTKKGPPCTMGSLLQLIACDDPESADDIQADLDNPHVSGTGIGRNLAAIGRPIGQHVIDRHRRGDCGCPK